MCGHYFIHYGFIQVCNFHLLKQPSRRVLRKGVLKICNKFTGEHSCPSLISIKSENNFIQITLQVGCSPVNLLHISRTPFLKNTSGGLYLHLFFWKTKFSSFCVFYDFLSILYFEHCRHLNKT